MATTPESREYDRPPVYGRPPDASLVKVIEKISKGATQTEAMKPRS